MKNVGYALIALGFLGGALAAVVEETTLPWGLFVLALGVGVAGIVLVRLGARRVLHAGGGPEAGLQELADRLARVVAAVGALKATDGDAASLDLREVTRRIDDDVRTDLAAFAEARKGIAHVYGLQAYADVMSHFAAGERYLNRVWSAAADGYPEEARTYLGEAETQFARAQSRLAALHA